MSHSSSEISNAIENVARRAGEIALRHFHDLGNVPVESKGHLDLVTAADQEVERFIVGELRRLFPEDGIVGEEGSSVSSKNGRVWVFDPIDGTFNFVRGGDQWAVSIGLFHDGAPEFGVIHAPVRQQTYLGGPHYRPTLNGERLEPLRPLNAARASSGVGFHPIVPVDDRLEVLRFLISDAGMTFRCCGAATISLMEIVSGQVDGYVGIGESPWDVMAALAILAPLGGVSTIDWSKASMSSKLKFACGGPGFLHAVEPIVPMGTTFPHPER
ncbi:inositol monophosphatase family protein [Microvirga pudoricolor]|uniref:inositol monophosphatase family protein n=1 Tax=Microvirga pudoricolor TaxID=2778729 RepID=UPI00194FEEE0|nr:inositol monophosphatase [Microvirga pudoricolor]MBM6592990.1 inositol monophosphatase [Microvirga pudoricolor]